MSHIAPIRISLLPSTASGWNSRLFNPQAVYEAGQGKIVGEDSNPQNSVSF
jgi:hypothetical protein